MPPLSNLLVEPTPGVQWYASYQMAMAFCRVTTALAAERGTKPEKEQQCLVRLVDRALGDACRGQAVRLVDLGTGDGHKMLLTIRALRAAAAGPIRYVPVDTNAHIARYAILNILGAGKPAWPLAEVERMFGPLNGHAPTDGSTTLGLETLVRMSHAPAGDAEYTVDDMVTVPMSGIPLDFFQHLPEVVRQSKRRGRGMGVFCLLGNTYGNYPAEWRDGFLGAMFAEIDAGDLFMLGVGLRPTAGPSYAEQVRRLVREYAPGAAFMQSGADHPDAVYRLQFDPQSHSMVHEFERPDGSIQPMGFSHLFSVQQTIEAFTRKGFEIVAHDIYPAEPTEPQYLTILARKPGRGDRS